MNAFFHTAAAVVAAVLAAGRGSVPASQPAARAEAGWRDGASGEPQTTTEGTTHSSLSSSPKNQ